MIFTIGHSTHRIERFLELLQKHGVTALADVRSTPYSRFNPHFNREKLRAALQAAKITYLFLGEELGARSKDPCCYEDGRVSYTKLAETELFKAGLERLTEDSKKHRIALMCAEKDPLTCHRTILVSRQLENSGIAVSHILDDGSIETHSAVMSRLRLQLRIPEHDMFRSNEELIEEAYKIQAQRIAYVRDSE